MGGYVVNFTVYTMAMLGLICFAVFVYKKIMRGDFGKKNTNFLAIEDTLNLNPRKSLHIIRAGNEKFLIASDVDRTTLISKLDDKASGKTLKIDNIYNQNEVMNFEQVLDSTDYANNSMKPAIKSKVKSSQVTNNQKQRIHLDPIVASNEKVVGISNFRRQSSNVVNNNVQQVEQNQPIRTSARVTMRDMAKKINEL